MATNPVQLYWAPVLLAAYYLAAWLIAVRNRRAASISVRYEPPAGLSVAAIRYLYTMSSDGRSYVAILAHLAARGLLAIVSGDGGKTVVFQKLIKADRAPRDLPEEEREVFEDLFEWDDRVPFKRPEGSVIEHIQKALDKRLPHYVTRNFAWVIGALALTGALVVGLSRSPGVFGGSGFDAWIGSLFTGFSVVMYSLAGYWLWDSNRIAFSLALRGIYHRRTLPVLLAFVLLYPSLWYLLMRAVTPDFAVQTTLVILLNGFAGPALRGYSRQGRMIRNQIEGFRLFLKSAEQDRLQRMNSPGAPDPFALEKIPYAIALDLREDWGDSLGIKSMVETAL